MNPMTYDDLQLLIDYNYWARGRVLDAVGTITLEQFTRPLGNSFSSVRIAMPASTTPMLRNSRWRLRK